MKRSLAVLITYYNERELLTDCLRSLVGQANPPDEIRIYDDASEHPAEKYVPSGISVKVVRGDRNVGPARARNRLWRSTSCEYVHFHDADDWFDSSWGTRVRHVLDTESPDVVFTEVSSHRDGTTACTEVLGLSALKDGGDLTQFCLHNPLLVPSGTYRRSLVETLNGYRESLWQSEDYDFHVRLAARHPDYRLLFEPLVHIRLRAESRSQNHPEVWACRLEALSLLAAELPPLYRRELSEEAGRVGSQLFQLGDRESARRAFDLAQRLGPPAFQYQQRLYRFVAKGLGPQTAEWVGKLYRNVLPSRVRDKIRSNGRK
jgi:glycosyltransferase involved in cell wall biosynthesis